MKKIYSVLIHIITSLAIILCIPLHAMNDPLVKFIKTTKSSEKIEQTCPKSNAFSSGGRGGVHTHTYNDVESMTIDFDFPNSAFQMDINGVTVHSNILELLNASLRGAGEVHLKFSDNTNITITNFDELGGDGISGTITANETCSTTPPTAGVWEENESTLFYDQGNIGIGNTDAKLTVKGNIHAEEVKVDLSVPAPDYVFKDDYKFIES